MEVDCDCFPLREWPRRPCICESVGFIPCEASWTWPKSFRARTAIPDPTPSDVWIFYRRNFRSRYWKHHHQQHRNPPFPRVAMAIATVLATPSNIRENRWDDAKKSTFKSCQTPFDLSPCFRHEWFMKKNNHPHNRNDPEIDSSNHHVERCCIPVSQYGTELYSSFLVLLGRDGVRTWPLERTRASPYFLGCIRVASYNNPKSCNSTIEQFVVELGSKLSTSIIALYKNVCMYNVWTMIIWKNLLVETANKRQEYALLIFSRLIFGLY
jgi:hypothetical protein